MFQGIALKIADPRAQRSTRRVFPNLVVSLCLVFTLWPAPSSAFVLPQSPLTQQDTLIQIPVQSRSHISSQSTYNLSTERRGGLVSRNLFEQDDRSDAEIEEEARVKVWESRRYQIRSVLKSAEGVRNLRLRNGWVPELDEDGKPIKSDGKYAVTITAFCLAAGAIALRIGGRAALMSAVGLDFANDNPELRDNLEQVLTMAENMDPLTKVGLFTLGWTGIKLFCFDAGGVVLGLASGILFGGVIQGAVASAAAATFGSSVAFGMAKLETPVRKKALELLDEYPSLRGIEKVVARDGLKAVLTLRLAPILPIPIGLYNYVYGVTNVPFFDFAGGIFLGSLKPYFLDSYLGIFGKEMVEGTSDGGGLQDILLLTTLAVSVLIGVFASQLAGETWDSVLEEVEAEKKAKLAAMEDGEEVDDGLKREFLGFELPQWAVDFQKSLKEADNIVEDLIAVEYSAKVWNYTKQEGGPPANLDPALKPGSPELEEVNEGLKLGQSFCIGLVLSPQLFAAFTKFADPLYDETTDDFVQERISTSTVQQVDQEAVQSQTDELLSKLEELRAEAEAKLSKVNRELEDL